MLLTPGPVSATSPAPSHNGTSGAVRGVLLISRSRKLSDAARIRTSTSPGPGRGTGRCAIASAEIPDPSRNSYAFIPIHTHFEPAVLRSLIPRDSHHLFKAGNSAEALQQYI